MKLKTLYTNIYILCICSVPGMAQECSVGDSVGLSDPGIQSTHVDFGTDRSYLLHENVISCCGIISTWTFVVKNPGGMEMQVWRPISPEVGLYRLVGSSNYSTDIVPDNPVVLRLEEQNKIPVRPGDVLGWKAIGLEMLAYTRTESESRNNYRDDSMSKVSPGDNFVWDITSLLYRAYAVTAFLSPEKLPVFRNLPNEMNITAATVTGDVIFDVDSNSADKEIEEHTYSIIIARPKEIFSIDIHTGVIKLLVRPTGAVYSIEIEVYNRCDRRSVATLDVYITDGMNATTKETVTISISSRSISGPDFDSISPVILETSSWQATEQVSKSLLNASSISKPVQTNVSPLSDTLPLVLKTTSNNESNTDITTFELNQTSHLSTEQTTFVNLSNQESELMDQYTDGHNFTETFVLLPSSTSDLMTSKFQVYSQINENKTSTSNSLIYRITTAPTSLKSLPIAYSESFSKVSLSILGSGTVTTVPLNSIVQTNTKNLTTSVSSNDIKPITATRVMSSLSDIEFLTPQLDSTGSLHHVVDIQSEFSSQPMSTTIRKGELSQLIAPTSITEVTVSGMSGNGSDDNVTSKTNNPNTTQPISGKNGSPVIHNLPASISLSNTIQFGTPVYVVIATDPENETLAYCLKCATNHCPFSIRQDGIIFVTGSIYDLLQSHTLLISVKDTVNSVELQKLEITAINGEVPRKKQREQDNCSNISCRPGALYGVVTGTVALLTSIGVFIYILHYRNNRRIVPELGEQLVDMQNDKIQRNDQTAEPTESMTVSSGNTNIKDIL